MKKALLMMTTLLLLSSCAKEEFVSNKGKQTSNESSAMSTTNKLCSQSTLISPKVDILMLWDNSSSFKFVTPATKLAMENLITSVSENFDYHILSAPLTTSNTNTLNRAILITKDPSSVIGVPNSVLKVDIPGGQTAKAQAIEALSTVVIDEGLGSSEQGVDRAISIIEANRSNKIFRDDAYTIIVIMSNEDDKGCSLTKGYICNNDYDRDQYLNPRINKLLCLRGNTHADCTGTGYTQTNSLNSAMMRFINISPLTKCPSGNDKINYSYKKVAKTIYEASYSNGWPTSNDHLSPDVSGAPDSYNLCSIDFSHIFDGVNTAIKQTLLKHKYDYWPVAGSNTPLDPDSLRVVRSDGKILTNRTGDSNPSDGYAFVGTLNNQPTRFYPTAGENFTGKMIQLFGVDGNDKVVYPDCLTVTYEEPKAKFGYIYLQNGTPKVETLEVYLNGVKVPQDNLNGWSYMGLTSVSALDPDLKVSGMPAGSQSGVFLRLNGSYQVTNSTDNKFVVFSNSTAN